MTIDLDALEKLADEATPGEWRVAEDNNPFADGRHVFAKGLDGTDFVVLNLKTDHTFVTATTRDQQKSNARFSAAANPATIKALIAELKEARAVIERLSSSEAFDMPQAISGPLASEMRARMDYARAFLARNGKGEG